jgi:hypothetical protein
MEGEVLSYVEGHAIEGDPFAIEVVFEGAFKGANSFKRCIQVDVGTGIAIECGL